MAVEVAGAAAEAFLDGFPSVFDQGQAVWFPCERISALPTDPFSVLSHAGAPTGPRDPFGSVNNDTNCFVLVLGRRTAGAAPGASLPVLDVYPSPSEALAGPVHLLPLETAQPA
ncbi:hypothetical protein ACFC4G_25330 [Streptomyces sp. NPDC056002]|uniref:hypothetical protein n=1 Tax=unclassified Streptomyces TaxID=2593676 RepID=UPI0035DD5E4B